MKKRLPLGPVTTWEVARLVALKHVAQRAQSARALDRPFPPISPTEIWEYLASALGWAPGPASLYTGILSPLREAEALVRNVHKDVPRATEVHLLTTYSPGPRMEEVLRIRTPPLMERLNASRRMLEAILPRLVDAAGAEPAPGIVTNTGTLLRWLCLYVLQEAGGTLQVAAFRDRLSAVTTTPNWPSQSMVYRALQELSDPSLAAVAIGDDRTSHAVLAAHGPALMCRLAAALQEPVKQALRFITTAADILRQNT